MVVPTPKLLERGRATTAPSGAVACLHRHAAPRLVDCFDGDPCARIVEAEPAVAEAMAGDGGTCRERREGAKALGVTLRREFAVGVHDMQMPSARQVNGLAEFPRGEG